MYTDPERSHVSCNVSSVLGPVSLDMLFRWHSEGEEDLLISIVCISLEIKRWTDFIGIFYFIKCRSGLLHQVEPLK